MKLKESNKIEFKRSTAELKKALEDLCAFANTSEGIVYFGIEDNGNIIGQNISDSTIKHVTTTILSSITPRLYPTITVETLEDHSILKVEIKSNPDKPYQYKGIYFKRVGTSNAYLTSAEVERMVFDKEHTKQHFDQLPIKNFKDKVDSKMLNWFLKTASQERGLNLGIGNKKREILEKLGLLSDGEQTLATILAFSNRGQKYFPNAGVKCAVFAGTDKTYPILDNLLIQKNIFEQVSDCQQFFVEKTRKESFVNPKTARREWKYHWPLQALREAVANAIAHRDYRIPSDIDVLLFDDRLEIWSPGGLPEGITVKKLNKPHKSFQRNPLIARLLYLVGYAESFGTGIQKMNQMLEEANLPLPEYRDSDGDFIVTFRKKTAATDLNPLLPSHIARTPGAIEQVTEQAVEQVTEQVKKMIIAVSSGEWTSREIMRKISITHRPTFLYNYLQPSLDLNFIEMTQPNSPKSPTQKYRLTEKGKQLLNKKGEV